MRRAFSLMLIGIFGAPMAALAQQAEHHAARMPLITLQGGLQYIDPKTKDVLSGYIEGGTLNPSPTDVVAFRVCNTTTTLHIVRGQLHDGPPCEKLGPSPWVAWRLEGGELVSHAGTAVMTLSINRLPDIFQSLLKEPNPNNVRAFSLPSPSGEKTLGVITKPNS